MAYTGKTARIELGQKGLMTDIAYTKIPLGCLVEAENIVCDGQRLEKAPGSERWNTSALPAGIVAATEFWPDTVNQRVFTLTRDGVVTRFETRAAAATVAVTAGDAAPTTLVEPTEQAVFLVCGAESSTRDKKLMLFTGRNQVQVVAGDGTTRRNISQPNVDWTGGQYPTAGFLHHNRLCAIGGRDRHRLYMSDPDDHENFVSNGLQFAVFPGEGDGLVGALVFKGRLFLFKSPRGIYYLDDTDPDTDNWAVRKFTDEIGGASAHGAVNVLDDFLFKTSEGSLFSYAATQKFGSVEGGDVLRQLQCRRAVGTLSLLQGNINTHALYYADKQTVYFTYRSTESLVNDRMLLLDVNDETPKVSFDTRNQANCLMQMRDIYGVLRPVYGADDGYLYRMDRETRLVGASSYTGMFRLPDLDFSWIDPELAEMEKRFEFLEVVFEETGDWDLSVNYWIDRVLVGETLTFTQSLATATETADDSVQGTGAAPRSIRLPLHGQGRRISIRGLNAGSNQSFRVVALVIGFMPVGQDTHDE